MLSRVDETRMRWVQAALALGWLVLIASLFYDPITPRLTRADNLSSPFRLSGHPVFVQGRQLEQTPYQMGVRVFWTMVVPCVPLFLMVFGHEAWRRICPLSFFSQLPRMLGIQSRVRRFSRTSGQVEERLRLVGPESWLRRNVWYVQFGLLWLGLSARLVWINSSRPALGSFLLFVIASTIFVGYRFGGKTWCNYICPASVIQRIYTEPRGLFESQAHLQKQPVTQSMCRVSTPGGVQSNCVGCVSPCPDIDLERAYWQTLDHPGRRFAYYGYFGLIVGFYSYYYLYAGNWDYFYSGAWTHECGTLSAATLLGPGLYIGGMAIPIPKLVAAPLTIALFIGMAYVLGCSLERLYERSMARSGRPVDRRLVLHRSFSVTTFLSINTFYLFAGRPNIRLLPEVLQTTLSAAIVTLSALWLVRSLDRTPTRYQRESVVNTLTKQLKKFKTDFSRFLEGRTLDDLAPDEVYLLAKTAPGFSQDQKQGVYKNVLRESIASGRTNSSLSLTMLAELRAQVGVTEDQHHAMLRDLGIEDPSLLDPHARKEQETQLRLDNYSSAFQALVERAMEQGIAPDNLAESPSFSTELRGLQSVYQISAEEHALTQNRLDRRGASWRDHTGQLLREVGRLTAFMYSLRHLTPDPANPVCRILHRGVGEQRHRHAATLLGIAAAADEEAVLHFAVALRGLLGEEAMELTRSKAWKGAIEANPGVEGKVLEALSGSVPLEPALPNPAFATFGFRDAIAAAPDPALVYAVLAEDPDPIMSGTAMVALARINAGKAGDLLRSKAGEFDEVPWFLREISTDLALTPAPNAKPHATVITTGFEIVPASTLSKLSWLIDIDLFLQMPLGALAGLARRGELRRYPSGASICQEGQRSDAMFLLLSGEADVFTNREEGVESLGRVSTGQTIGEMGVFTKKPRAATVVVSSETADVLAFSEEHLDEVWENPHASRGVLLRVFEYYQQARGHGHVLASPPEPPSTTSFPGTEDPSQ